MARADRRNYGLARLLGVVSFGVAAMELAAPQKVQEMLGIRDRPEHRGILRILGLRECLHGIGILGSRSAAPGLTAGVWSRVAGDMVDTAVLGVAATKTRKPKQFATWAGVILCIGLLDTICATGINS